MTPGPRMRRMRSGGIERPDRRARGLVGDGHDA